MSRFLFITRRQYEVIPFFFNAEHLGLEPEKAFLDRPDRFKPGTEKGRYVTFCPISAATEKRRAAKSRLSPGVSSTSPPFSRDEKSALALQYDLELHQMVAYMRRLDGAYPPDSRGRKSMNPFAPDGAGKWATSGSKTPLCGFWTYYAWEHVLSVVFSSAFGTIFTVSDPKSLKRLLTAEVMM